MARIGCAEPVSQLPSPRAYNLLVVEVVSHVTCRWHVLLYHATSGARRVYG